MIKCKSKIFVFLLTATLMLAVLPGLKVKADEVKSGDCGSSGDNVKWELDNGTLTISGKGDMANFSITYAPWRSYTQSIKTINISEGVTSIGSYAFMECDGITSINIPNGVTSIGTWAFFTCDNLYSITIPNSVKTIGDTAFGACKALTSITIPKSVETIDSGAFNYCEKLTSVTMDRSLKSQCDSKKVFIGGSSYIAFTYYTYDITYADVKNGKVSGADTTAEATQTINLTVTPDTGYAVKEVTYTVNGEATVINPDSSGNYSFTMPSCDTTVSATFIPFGYCGAEEGGKNLTWTYDDSTKTLTISGKGDMAKYTEGRTPWVSYKSKIYYVVISDGVTSIGDSAFDTCTNLTSLTLPNSVTSIGDTAFCSCTMLTSINIPNSVESIDGHAFTGCFALTDITIPNSVNSIGFRAFAFCQKLTSVTMDKSLKKTCDSAEVFIDCPSNLTFTYYTYDITYADAKNGTVSGKDKSPSTDTITLTVTPDANYVVDKVTVTDSKETKTIDRDTSGKYSFVMPSEAVKVEASFKLDSKTVTFESDDGKVLQSITVDYGTSPKYTEAEPAKQDDNDYTYTFAGWKNGTNTYGPKDVLPAVTGDITYTAVFTGTAKPKPGTYYLDGMTEKDGNIIIAIKQTEDDTKTYDLLGTVSSDGTLLAEGTQYTTARGSAIITIQKSYLETLQAGTHKLEVAFTDGGSISINYEVKAAAQSGAKSVPSTGEGFAASAAIGSIMVIISCGFAVTVLLRKHRENI